MAYGNGYDAPNPGRGTMAELLGLDELNNFWGPLSADVRKRLLAVLKHPTNATWSNAHGIILRNDVRGMGLTLWQAWIAIDPTAPRVGPASTYNKQTGKYVTEKWKHLPTPENVFNAIRYATLVEGKVRT